jgi:ABC-type nitrate/sulfonate/bicarbonate transport system permease component
LSIPPRKGEGDEAADEKPVAEQKPVRDPAAEAAALAAMEAELDGDAPRARVEEREPVAAVAKAEAKAETKAEKEAEAKAEAKAEKDAEKSAAKATEAAAEKKAHDAKVAAKEAAKDDPNKIPSAPTWWKALRKDPPFPVQLALGFGLIAVLLIVWSYLTHGSDPTARIISPSKLPSPGEVFGSLKETLDSGFVSSLIDSLTRVFKGVFLAGLIGISFGVLAASNRGVGSALEPFVIFLRSVPMGALLPLTLLLFGTGEKQKAMFIFLAVVPFVFSDVVKAASIVPERYVETAQTLGASRWQIIYKVLVPLALPDIITSLRYLLGLAIGYIMLAEVIDAPHGLGTMLNTFQHRGKSENIYLLLFAIALIAFLIDYLLRTIQRGVFSWRGDL